MSGLMRTRYLVVGALKRTQSTSYLVVSFCNTNRYAEEFVNVLIFLLNWLNRFNGHAFSFDIKNTNQCLIRNIYRRSRRSSVLLDSSYARSDISNKTKYKKFFFGDLLSADLWQKKSESKIKLWCKFFCKKNSK